jgi:hypothetical protein
VLDVAVPSKKAQVLSCGFIACLLWIFRRMRPDAECLITSLAPIGAVKTPVDSVVPAPLGVELAALLANGNARNPRVGVQFHSVMHAEPSHPRAPHLRHHMPALTVSSCAIR